MKAALAKLNGQSLASKKLPMKEADPELVVYTIDSGVASFEPGADHRHTPRSAERCCLPCKCNPITKTITSYSREYPCFGRPVILKMGDRAKLSPYFGSL